MATYTEQLAEVNAAITKVMGGQEVQAGDRRVRRADLAQLLAERKRLEPLALREAAGRTGFSVSRGAG